MKNSKESLAKQAKRKLMRAFKRAAVPTRGFGEGWPWCQGIFYQPKHPLKVNGVKKNTEL